VVVVLYQYKKSAALFKLYLKYLFIYLLKAIGEKGPIGQEFQLDCNSPGDDTQHQIQAQLLSLQVLDNDQDLLMPP